MSFCALAVRADHEAMGFVAEPWMNTAPVARLELIAPVRHEQGLPAGVAAAFARPAGTWVSPALEISLMA